MRISPVSKNTKCIPPECLGHRWKKGKMLGKDKYIDYSVGCGGRGEMMQRTFKKKCGVCIESVERKCGENVSIIIGTMDKLIGPGPFSPIPVQIIHAVLSATIDDHLSRSSGQPLNLFTPQRSPFPTTLCYSLHMPISLNLRNKDGSTLKIVVESRRLLQSRLTCLGNMKSQCRG